MAWRENRNDKVLIKHATILVSSSTMSQLSPEFYKLFTTQDGSLRTCVELPDEDPVAFSMICESAHGSFVPHDQISLQTLAHIANAIQRYKIPTTSRVRHTTEFTFTVYASRLDTLTTIELLALLGVAKALGITRYKKLLEDAFLLYPLQFEALHMEHVAGGCDTDCAILANLKLRGAACRAQVAITLLSSLNSDYTHYQKEKCGLAVWILKDSLSLQEINTCLRRIRSTADRHSEQLLDASGAICEATADINHYVRTTIGQAQEVEEGARTDIVTGGNEVKRLEIQIAKSGQNPGDLVVADDSSSDTDFEDIEAYAGSLGECGDGLQFSDDESVTSAKTI